MKWILIWYFVLHTHNQSYKIGPFYLEYQCNNVRREYVAFYPDNYIGECGKEI